MLPTPQDINPDFPLPLRGGPGEPLDTERRYFLTFPGVNQVVETGVRLIDDPASGFVIGFQLLGEVPQLATIVAQNVTAAPGERELQIFIQDGFFRAWIGGNLLITGVPSTRGNYKISYDGTNFQIIKNNVIVHNQPFIAGQNVEPSATFTIGARHDDSLSSYSFYYTGVIANVRISDNGTPVRFYPLDRGTIGGNDGTYINGAAADWGRFERSYGGDWQGQGLTVPPWASADQILEIA